MKRLIFLCLLFLSGCASYSPQSAYNTALSSTVKVDGPTGSGSGVVINPHCIVTAGHVTDQKNKQQVLTQDGKEYLIVRYYLAEFSDLAVACVDGTFAAPPARIRMKMPDQYASVFTIGNPLGENNVLTIGNYQGDNRMTAPIAWGNSGGGVFDESGNLIGIAVAITVRRIENYVFVIPHLAVMTTIRDIVPFLDENAIPFYRAE